MLGAVQLPPSGQPVVFLADHPTTGGYPVVAVVEDDDLDLCAQLRPGDEVRLQVVTAAVRHSSAGRRQAVQRRVVGPEGPHRSRRGVGGLEPHGHDPRAGAPHPAAPISSCTTSAPGGHVRRGGSGGTSSTSSSSAGLAEEVLLDPVGEAGDADTEEAHAAGGVEVGEQRARHAGRWSRRRRWGW